LSHKKFCCEEVYPDILLLHLMHTVTEGDVGGLAYRG
jgi:hypothetical protein